MLTHRITTADLIDETARKRTAAFLRSRPDLRGVEVALSGGRSLSPGFMKELWSYRWTLTSDPLSVTECWWELPWVLSAAVALHVVRTGQTFDAARDMAEAKKLLREALNLIDQVPDEPPTRDHTVWYMEVTRGWLDDACVERIVPWSEQPGLSFTARSESDAIDHDEERCHFTTLSDLQRFAGKFLAWEADKEQGRPPSSEHSISELKFYPHTVTGPKMSPIEWATAQPPDTSQSQ